MPSEIPYWVHQSHEWRATLHVLDNSSLSYKDCRKHVDFEERIIDFPWMLEEANVWSDGEQILLRVAMDLYNGGGNAVLSDILQVLDKENINVVIEAIKIRRGLVPTGI